MTEQVVKAEESKELFFRILHNKNEFYLLDN